MCRRFRHFARSNLIALAALVVALCGASAYAAAKLPKNSVGTKQLKKGAVTSAKIRNGAVTGAKINLSTLPPAPLADNANRLGGSPPSVFQLRVTGSCPSGQAITAVGAGGSVTCTLTGGPPSGPASGDLTGTYPGPQIANGVITDAMVAAANRDGSASTPSLRTLGTGAQQAMPGNATPGGPPTGSAGGTLSGTYPNPTLNVSGSPCAAGEFVLGVSNLAALSCGPTGSNANLGQGALSGSSTASNTTAVGNNAAAHTTGSGATNDTALGAAALQANTSGFSNTALGASALTALSSASGQGNTAIGAGAGQSLTNGSNNIYIGRDGASTESNVIRIGVQGTQTFTTLAGVNGASTVNNANLVLSTASGQLATGTSGTVSLAGVDGATSSSGVPVLINSSGTLGTATSSRRFKTDIHPIGTTLERALMALRPVSFHYKKQYIKGQPDPREYGLIAEEVAKIDPSLVAWGKDGKPYTVRYQELPVLLLSELQHQQQQINTQQNEIDWLMAHQR